MSTSRERENRTRTYTDARAVAKAQESGGGLTTITIPKDAKLFEPKAGIRYLDIIPYCVGVGNPRADKGMYHYERTFFTHRSVGAASTSQICLARTANKACPICEFRARLQNEPGADPKIIKDMAPRVRQLFNVIDDDNPKLGIQLWEMSYSLFGEKLNERITGERDSDPEGWARFASPTDGFHLKVDFRKDSFGGRDFLRAANIDLRPRKKQYDEDIVDRAYCLDDLLKIQPYQKLKDILLETTSSDEERPAPVDAREPERRERPAEVRSEREREPERRDDRGGREADREPEPSRGREERPASRERDREPEPAPREREPERRSSSRSEGWDDEAPRSGASRQEDPPRRPAAEREERPASRERDREPEPAPREREPERRSRDDDRRPAEREERVSERRSAEREPEPAPRERRSSARDEERPAASSREREPEKKKSGWD